MQTNQQFDLAFNLLQNTGTNLFLTGKAGTGKTTFLKRLKEVSPKRMIVVAPTGVAAINAGGVTIHSFFQLPFGPYIPSSPEYRGGKTDFKNQFRKDKINIIRSMDLLVIDEVSMVTGEMKKRYGFIYVDRDNEGSGTLKRLKKDSFYWYKKVIASNGENL